MAIIATLVDTNTDLINMTELDWTSLLTGPSANITVSSDCTLSFFGYTNTDLLPATNLLHLVVDDVEVFYDVPPYIRVNHPVQAGTHTIKFESFGYRDTGFATVRGLTVLAIN